MADESTGQSGQGRGFQREVAHRLFAAEFNASRAEIKGQGEKDPSFLVSPLGAKVNRLHVVGVCTDVESVGESGEVWRARISDPTGIFTLYAGNYQPEAAQTLSQLQSQLPAFVAVTGKARTYEPEPGSVFVSIRPETVTVVDRETRDQWLVDTARRTQSRIVAAEQVTETATAGELTGKGVAKPLAEGLIFARDHYGSVATAAYRDATRQAVSPLASGGDIPVQRMAVAEDSNGEAQPWRAPSSSATPSAAPGAVQTMAAPANNPAQDALDDAVMAVVTQIEGDKGARWDDVLSGSAKEGVTAEDVEEALNRLMDKGLVYEPTLGVLRST